MSSPGETRAPLVDVLEFLGLFVLPALLVGLVLSVVGGRDTLVAGLVIGGLFGIPVGMLPQIMQLIWNDKIHEGNVPTIDQFATNFTGAIQWPQVEGWQVTGGTFRAAFLLGGKAGS